MPRFITGNSVTKADVDALTDEDWERLLTDAVERLADRYPWLDFELEATDDLVAYMIAWLKKVGDV